jgi:urea transport system substrate-binding protein
MCHRSSVKVGILHSQTGTMSISEISLRDAELLAIDEINAKGGVLGRQIEPVVEDGRSRFTTVFPKKARKLLLEDKVAVVFGCWTSSSRKAVLPVVEELNGLLFYPVQYEGNESSRSIVYTGAAPNQQILPAIEWLMSVAGGSRKRIYLVGSDYVFPRTANFIITKYLQARGTGVAGESYTPLGHNDYKETVQQIRKADPDAIFSTINGESNVGFYNELTAKGITSDKIPVVATSVGEDELRSLLPDRVRGHFAAWNYFQSIDTP